MVKLTGGTVAIALTTAIALDGEIFKAGEQVEVSEDLAKDLLYRGRGTLIEADPEDGHEDDDEQNVDLSKLNKAQLVEFAKHEYDQDLDSALTKEQMIEKIQTFASEV